MAAAAPVLEIVAGVVGGLAMAACVVGAVRFVQQRRRRARQAQLGLGADERRFKRRLEQSIAEVDNIFADDDDDDDEDEDEDNGGDQGAAGELDGELDDEDREQLKLIEAERSKGSPKKKSSESPWPRWRLCRTLRCSLRQPAGHARHLSAPDKHKHTRRRTRAAPRTLIPTSPLAPSTSSCATAAATPARGAGATATPAGGGGDSSVNDEEGAESASLTASSNKR